MRKEAQGSIPSMCTQRSGIWAATEAHKYIVDGLKTECIDIRLSGNKDRSLPVDHTSSRWSKPTEASHLPVGDQSTHDTGPR
jgi:hypothetical protein